MAKLIDRLMLAIEAVVSTLLAVEVLMVVLQIFCRYVLHSPLNWTDQMCRFGLVWIIMLGIPVMFNRKATVAFDLIFAKTKGRVRKLFQVLYNVLGVFFAIVFLMCSVQYVQKSGGLTVAGFSWMKYWYLYISEVVSAALLLVVMAKETVLSLIALAEEKRR